MHEEEKKKKKIPSDFVAAYVWRFQSYISRLANRQADKDPDKVIATPFTFFPPKREISTAESWGQSRVTRSLSAADPLVSP